MTRAVSKDKRFSRRRHTNDTYGGSGQGSIFLSLSLFIILLAFFIVMNAVSSFSENKVTDAFDSLDIAFAKNILRTDFAKQSDDEREENAQGAGDSIEDMRNVLRSLLPGLDVSLTDDPNGGGMMAVRMKKNRFARLSNRLIPLFARILRVRDKGGAYELVLESYVRDPLAPASRLSYAEIEKYRDAVIEQGIAPDFISLAVEKGNPAYLLFRFTHMEDK